MAVFLGIDVGTQSVKLVAYDAERHRIVKTCHCALDLISRDDGSREQMVGWWLTAIRACFDELDRNIKSRVKAIGVSGQQHGFVPMDRNGQVLAPVKLWCDTSTVEECSEITEAVGGTEQLISIAGNPILPGYTASKVRWLKKHKPDAYAEMTTILLPHDYINYYLTGDLFMEYGDASGTGWLNIHTRQWSSEILVAMDNERDLKECLPSLVPPDEANVISKSAAEEFGLPYDTIVSPGGGDNMMTAIGTGNVMEGCLTMSLGTSGTIFACSDKPAIDPEGDFAAFCSSTGGWLPLLCTMNCTVATETIRNLMNLELTQVEALLNSTRTGADGIVTLPFYNGERTPDLPHGKGCIMGLDLQNTTGENLFRSAMEGATFALRSGFETFKRAELSFSSICVTGGGAASAGWRQMVADVFQLPVTTLQEQEGGALGAALQSLWVYRTGQGHGVSISDIVAEHLLVEDSYSHEPNPRASADYNEYYQTYLRHLEVISPLYTGGKNEW